MWGLHEEGSLFNQVVENTWEKPRSNTSSRSTENQFFMYLRVNTLNKLVPYAAQRFIDNLSQIYEDGFDHALLEDTGSSSQLLGVYRNVVVKHVFSHSDVGQLELQSYQVISGLLEICQPLLKISRSGFSGLADNERAKRFPIESRLFQKLFTCHRLACVETVSRISTGCAEHSVLEYYRHCRLIQDYTSGVTDLYTWGEYRRLMTVE